MRALISNIEGFIRPVVSYLPTGWVAGIATRREAWVTPVRPGAVHVRSWDGPGAEFRADWSEQDLPDPPLYFAVQRHLHMAGWKRVMAMGVTTKKAWITGDSPSGERWIVTGKRADALPDKEIRLRSGDRDVTLGTDLTELTEWLRKEQEGATT